MGCHRLCRDSSQNDQTFILLAPAGMGHELGWTAKLVRDVPIIGDWLFMATYATQHRRGCEVERALDTTVPFVVDRQQKELQYRGFIPSVLASLRGALANDTKEDHQRIAYTIWTCVRFGALMMLSYLSLPKIS